MAGIALEAVDGGSGRLVLLVLLHSLWIGIVVASTVALVFPLCPRLSHQARYLMLVVALTLVTVGPAVVTSLNRGLAYRATSSDKPYEVFVVASDLAKINQTRPSPADSVGSTSREPHRSAPFPSPLSLVIARSINAINCLQQFLLGAWLVGVATLTVLLALSARAVHRLGFEARPAPKAVALRATFLARLANLRRPPRVMVHPRLSEPCLCGLFRPLILLPDAWLAECPSEMLDAILAHELAHAQRLDHVVNLAQRLVEALLFFSPAVHWLSRSLRRQREFCADSLAVRLTRDPLALAAALESIARLRLTSHARPVFGPALGGQNVSLLPRIQELLGMKPSRQRPRLWPLGALPIAGLLASIAAASGLSQDQPAGPKDQVETGQNRNANRPEPRTKPESGFAAKLDAPPAPADQPKNKREINYHFQTFDLTTDALHELFKDSTRLLMKEKAVTAWIVNDVKVGGLIGQLRRPIARSLGCSEASTSDAAPLTIAMYPPPRQQHKNPMIGHYLRVTGSIQADKIRLAADFRFLSPEETAGKSKESLVDSPLRPENGEIPTQQLRRVSLEVKDGATLAVAFKPDWRDGRDLEPVVDKKSEAKADIKARPTANERLLLITAKSEFPDEAGPNPAIIGSFDDKTR
jgi:beta-lactamase regulating signal transducer with metallopeptidase domain